MSDVRNSLPDANLLTLASALTRTLGPVSFTPLALSAQIACTDHAEEPRPTLQENVMKRLAFVRRCARDYRLLEV